MKWISVNDRLPKKEGVYMVYGNCTNDGVRIDMAEFWCGEFQKYRQPTHWKPLPKPPTE